MAILDSLKDPNTGQIKKPILFSMIGAGGLVTYLLFKGKTTAGVSQTGQPALDLSGLTNAIQGMAGGSGGGGGGSGTGASLDPPASFGNNTNVIPLGSGVGLHGYAPTPKPSTTPISSIGNNTSAVPMSPIVPGSSGAAGGGGGGTGSVIHAIAKDPTVYAGLTSPVPLAITATNTPAKIVAALSPTQTKALVTQTVLGKNQNLRTPAISEAAMSKTAPTVIKRSAVAPTLSNTKGAVIKRSPTQFEKANPAPKAVVKPVVKAAPVKAPILRSNATPVRL